MIWEEMSPHERDALVATQVLGLSYARTFRGDVPVYYSPAAEEAWPGPLVEVGGEWPRSPTIRVQDLPSYSQDMGAAWQVVEHLLGERCLVLLANLYGGGWQVSIRWGAPKGQHEITHAHQTAPEAICRAALAFADATRSPAEGGDEERSASDEQGNDLSGN